MKLTKIGFGGRFIVLFSVSEFEFLDMKESKNVEIGAGEIYVRYRSGMVSLRDG